MALTIVKCGGAALAKEPFVLGRYVDPGSGVCVVHGAGTRISAALLEAGIESTFAGGRRVTTEEALPIVREAFRQENRALCSEIGPRAYGLMGDDLGLEAERVPELGHVGMLLPVVPSALWELLATDGIPVIAPLARCSNNRGPLNVNADDAAAVLAVALGADRLVFVSDVPGVLVGGEVIRELSERDISQLNGHLSGGIVPKLQAAVVAAREGVRVNVGQTTVIP
ncbi:MAG: argB [Actinomycetia bacterium]|nr:argB [Actinomycetes bacterium]